MKIGRLADWWERRRARKRGVQYFRNGQRVATYEEAVEPDADGWVNMVASWKRPLTADEIAHLDVPRCYVCGSTDVRPLEIRPGRVYLLCMEHMPDTSRRSGV